MAAPSPVHTPDELLTGARRLLESGDPIVLRAAVLEAITALESFVHQRVFAALRERIDPLLVKWLEDKTKMDFDSRLSVFTPIATGIAIDQSAELWARYKDAKQLRNAVTHSGRKVTPAEATKVLETVRDWLAYLASSAELDAALGQFKREVEAGHIRVSDGRSASEAIGRYFSTSSPAHVALEQDVGRGVRADVVLRFGPRLAVIETKFLRHARTLSRIDEGVKQLESLMSQAGADRGALVVFSPEAIRPGESHLVSMSSGKVSVVSIQVPSGDV